MIREKKILWIQRSIWLFILTLSILIPVILLLTPWHDVKIEDEKCSIKDIGDNRNRCEFVFTFNEKIQSGWIVIAFYDINGGLLLYDDADLFGYGQIQNAIFFVEGKIDSYKIWDHSVVINEFDFLIDNIAVFVVIWSVSLFFTIASLLFSCKLYYYEGQDIIVYTGWYRHYLKVNGRILSKRYKPFFIKPLTLESALYDGAIAQATISVLKRISFKIDDQIYTNRKRYSRKVIAVKNYPVDVYNAVGQMIYHTQEWENEYKKLASILSITVEKAEISSIYELNEALQPYGQFEKKELDDLKGVIKIGNYLNHEIFSYYSSKVKENYYAGIAYIEEYLNAAHSLIFEAIDVIDNKIDELNGKTLMRPTVFDNNSEEIVNDGNDI